MAGVFGSFDKLTEAFAASAVDPARWDAAMDMASDATGSLGAILVPLRGCTPNLAKSESMHGVVEDYVGAGWIHRDERTGSIPTILRRGVSSESDFTTPEEMAKNPYYQDFLGRHRLKWFAGVKVGEGEDVWALTLQRTPAQGPFSPDELARLADLSRRLAGAAALARAFGFARMEGALAAFAMSRTPAAAAVDRAGEVVRLNPSAERLLGPDLQVAKKRLASFSRDATAALDRALHALIWTKGEAFHAPVVLPRRLGRPIVAYPCRLSPGAFGGLGPCAGFVTFADLDARLTANGGALASAFGLTPAEAGSRCASWPRIARSGRRRPRHQHRHGAQPAQGRLPEDGRAPPRRDHRPPFAPGAVLSRIANFGHDATAPAWIIAGAVAARGADCERGEMQMRHLFPGASNQTFAFLLGAAFLSAAPAARAAVTFYDNEAAWEAAVAGAGESPTTFTFAAAPGSTTSYSNAAGYTVDGVNFVGRDDHGFYLYLIGEGYYASDYPVAGLSGPPTSSAYYRTSNGATDLTFLGGTTAFGLRAYTVHTGDTTGSYTDTLNLTVDGSTGSATSASGANYLTLPGSGFIGFVSTTPATSGVLTGTGAENFVSVAQLSNVPGGVPEPSSCAMLLLGFAGLGWAGWRPAAARTAGTPA